MQIANKSIGTRAKFRIVNHTASHDEWSRRYWIYMRICFINRKLHHSFRFVFKLCKTSHVSSAYDFSKEELHRLHRPPQLFVQRVHTYEESGMVQQPKELWIPNETAKYIYEINLCSTFSVRTLLLLSLDCDCDWQLNRKSFFVVVYACDHHTRAFVSLHFCHISFRLPECDGMYFKSTIDWPNEICCVFSSCDLTFAVSRFAFWLRRLTTLSC